PDRDYYLQGTFSDKKAKYRDYVARMLGMLGWDNADQRATDVVAYETAIAAASWSRAESRNRDRTYNPMTPAALEGEAPGFPWATWLAAARVGEVGRIVVRQKSALPKLAKVFDDAPLATVQAWAAFHLVDQTAPYLSRRFAQARFDFRARELAGQPQQLALWKRGTQLVNGTLGEALGKEYVDRHFSADSKTKMEDLVAQLRIALQKRIE